MLPLEYQDQKPWYISDEQVHNLLMHRIPDMAELISASLQRSSEYGGFLFESEISQRDHIRGISCPLSLTLLEIGDKHKTLAYNKKRFFVIDDQALDSMTAAALIVCAFRTHFAALPSFSIEDDGPTGYYLAQAVLEGDLCDEVKVPTQEMSEFLDDDDRVSVGDGGEAYFSSSLGEIPKESKFVSALSVEVGEEELADAFECLMKVDGDVQGPWETMPKIFRDGPLQSGPVLFLCTKSLVCKRIVVKMLLDATER